MKRSVFGRPRPRATALLREAVRTALVRPGSKVGGATRHRARRGPSAAPRQRAEKSETIDPHRIQGVRASHVARDLFEGLINEAPNGDLEPGAAESWTVSEDGKTYRFALRRNAKWSNGDPVTANDFVYGLRRAADPKTLSATRSS